jgi:hypothetical protein
VFTDFSKDCSAFVFGVKQSKEKKCLIIFISVLDPGDRGTMILLNIRTTVKLHFTVPLLAFSTNLQTFSKSQLNARMNSVCLIGMDFTFPQLHVFSDYALHFPREISPILCCIVSSQDFYLFQETLLKDE